MKVRDIRNLTGLSQVKFCKKYKIPRRTLEDWESGKSKAAEYLIELLEFKVRHDYGLDGDGYLVLPKEYDD